MASQYAGWAINPEGSSRWAPVRCARRRESSGSCSRKLGYAEEASRGVLVLEGRTLPDDDVAAWVAAKCGVRAGRRSLCRGADRERRRRRADRGAHHRDGAAQDGRARVRRDACAERHRHGADSAGGEERHPRHRPHQRLHPLRRPGALPRRRRRRELAELAERLPASASKDYGTPFHDIFKRYDNDFYKIDPMLFSPAEVWLTSAISGRTFHAGRLNPDVLARIALRQADVALTHARRDPQRAHRVAHRRVVPARSPRAATSGASLPYEALVARLGRRDARLWRAIAQPLLDADAVLARIIPNGSLEQIIYRVDALHWIEERGIPVMNSPRAIERSRGQVLYDGAAAGGRPAGARDRGLRARRRTRLPRCGRWAT